MELLDADWLTEGPIRLNETLSLSDLSGSRVNQRYYRATPRDGVAPIGEPGEKQREGLRGGREGGYPVLPGPGPEGPETGLVGRLGRGRAARGEVAFDGAPAGSRAFIPRKS